MWKRRGRVRRLATRLSSTSRCLRPGHPLGRTSRRGPLLAGSPPPGRRLDRSLHGVTKLLTLHPLTRRRVASRSPPELAPSSSVNDIFRSVGPVISTRRSRCPAETRPVQAASDVRVSSRKPCRAPRRTLCRAVGLEKAARVAEAPLRLRANRSAYASESRASPRRPPGIPRDDAFPRLSARCRFLSEPRSTHERTMYPGASICQRD